MRYDEIIQTLDNFLSCGENVNKTMGSGINLEKYEKIIIYGAGKGGKYTKYLLKRVSKVPEFFIDKNAKSGDSIDEIEVIRPDAKEAYVYNSEDVLAIISIGDFKVYDEIYELLRALGYKKIITYMELFNQTYLQADNQLAVNVSFEYFRENRQDILKAVKLFEDDESLEVYSNFIKGHATKGQVEFSKPCEGLKYHPSNLNMESNFTNFVDCGAGYGETYQTLGEKGIEVKTLLMFEPDKINYSILLDNLKKQTFLNPVVYTWPCAVYSKTDIIAFDHCGTAGSNILSKSAELVQAVKLDQVLFNYSPTFIKMDIEGAELEAVLGSKEIISSYKPQLAICIYHAINHIWDIPLLIDSWKLDYEFYLRSHNIYGMNTVLYVKPRKGILKE